MAADPFTEYYSKGSATPAPEKSVEADPFAEFYSKDSSGEPVRPTDSAPDSGIKGDIHNIARTSAETVPSAAAGIVGFGAGMSAAAPVAAVAAPLTGPFAPITAGVIELAGGLGGAWAASGAAQKVTNWMHEAFAPDDFAARQKEKEAHPYGTFAAELGTNLLGMSPKTGVEVAGKILTKPIVQRGASAGLMGAIEAGSEYADKGEIDPLKVGASMAAGATMPGFNPAGKKLFNAGEKAVDALKGKKPTSTPTGVPPKPPEGATPEEKANYISELKRRKAALDEKATLKQTAIRNKETGEIELMGPKHDEARKQETTDTHEQGFVDERGNFLTRKEAWDRATKTGQIPKDQVPENVKEGLHSGDLRKAGVKDFEITKDKPAGEPVAPEEPKAPVSREDFKKAIGEFDDQMHSKMIESMEADMAGDHAGKAKADAEFDAMQKQKDKMHQDMPEVQFEDKAKPSWEELHDHLWGAKTVGEAFDRIAKAGIGSKTQRTLLSALNRSGYIREATLSLHNELISYTNQAGEFKKDASGLYTGGDQHHVDLGQHGSVAVLAHEAVHAGTQKLIDSGKSKAAIELKRLYELHKSGVEGQYEAALEKYKAANPKATMGELSAFKQASTYGLTNAHEFIAEAFSNKRFRKLLSELPADPNKQPSKLNNMWTAFKDAVAEGLGLEANRSALDDVLDQGIKMIEKSQKFESKPAVDSLYPSVSPEEASKLGEATTAEVGKAAEKVDVRTIPNKEAFLDHATDIYHKYGEAEAIKFFEDYRIDQNKRSIPVPDTQQGLDDALHKIDTWQTADKSEHVIGYKETSLDGMGERPSLLHPIERKAWDKKAKAQLATMNELREAAFFVRENGGKVTGKLGEVLDAIDSENLSLVRKIKALGGDVGDEFATGQSRIRVQGGVTSNWKKMITELFANRMPFSEKVADTANAAHERKVFQLDDGRVIEIHRQPEDRQMKYLDEKGKEQTKEVFKGTEIWEWKNGIKSKIGHSPDLEFKMGDEVTLKDHTSGEEKKFKMVDGKVDAIEADSPYRYLHDAEASARLANMGLRKMARDLELIENLKKSELFKKVAHAPTDDLKSLPPGWKTPDSIDKIPQLRGYHFDPKTAAIIEDFAKVWDSTMWTKLSNQIVKNMMLNPLPHMMNEVMHLWNARGFTGWVNPKSFARFGTTGKAAFNDVMTQSQFYRDVMREGGSILGAEPRNNYFDKMIIEHGKSLVADKEMGHVVSQLAKRLGTSVGDLYNGISRASQKAMWVTRDVMYVQYIREIMKIHPGMDLKGAIAKAETHMPNYRMPSEVLGSRGIAKVLKNPNISMFSRYHYGMVKSLVNTLKDINPANLKSPEGRAHFREGVDSMMAIGVAMAVLYPLADELAQAMFGEGAEQRRAGPYHLIHAGEQVAKGEKDMSALIWPIFTFNPMLLMLGQLAFNKKIFSGKEIYHPQDKLADQVGDVASYAVKQIPQAPGIMGAGEEGGTEQLIAKNLDIKVKTAAQRAKERTARKREAATTKSRDTKRKKGTYNP
jgi:hypothetical protein